MTALRAAAVYVLMLVVIRLLGKRTVGNFSAFDLLVALMLGEVVDEVIFADVSFPRGILAILVIAGLHYANSWLSFRHPRVARLTEGTPTAVIVDGQLQEPGLSKERMSAAEVLAALRLQGILRPDDVKLAQVETDGIISVIKQDWAEALQKKDLLAALHARERAARPTAEPAAAAPAPE